MEGKGSVAWGGGSGGGARSTPRKTVVTASLHAAFLREAGAVWFQEMSTFNLRSCALL